MGSGMSFSTNHPVSWRRSTHHLEVTGGKDFPWESMLRPKSSRKRLHQALEGLDGVLTVHDDMIIYGTGDTIRRNNRWPQPQVWGILDQMQLKERDQAQQKEIATANHGGHLYGKLSHKQGVAGRSWEDQSNCQHAQAGECEGGEAILWVSQLSRKIPAQSGQRNGATSTTPTQGCAMEMATWAWRSIWEDQDYGHHDTVTVILWPCRGTDHPDWLEREKTGCGSYAEWPAHCMCQSSTDRDRASICTNWEEMLEVVFALQKFDQYVYGRTVTIPSDLSHLKPLPRSHCTQRPSNYREFCWRTKGMASIPYTIRVQKCIWLTHKAERIIQTVTAFNENLRG